MQDHKVVKAGQAASGHFFCSCGRKINCRKFDENGQPVWSHTSGKALIGPVAR